ncbi:MAG TPA: NADH-quinone oxidoreductase subunit H [Acetobacteraceae bacterium]|nr:NADH-quinone oxidoreductase subunit H [Acetobacteraceae bacterium]
MTFLLATFAQALHITLMLVGAPVVAGLQRWTEARLAGRTGADPWQAWRDLARLARKQPVLAENASPLFRTAPIACFAAMAVAAALVPSFTLGMAFAPLSDLLVLAGLLGFARVVLALAALDAGTAPAGLAAGRTASIACLAEPAMFLVILALGLLGGTTNLDLLIGQQHQGMLQPPAAAALAAAALALLALAGAGSAGQTTEFSGGDLALIELAEALRMLVWVDLIGALFLPLGMAAPGAGLLGWVVGLAAWGARVAVLVGGLAALRCIAGRLRLGRAPAVVGIAAVLGLLAALLVLASAVAA